MTTSMHIAITGGIGSGKTYVCQRLAARGITVYDCDKAAKRLMHTSPQIRRGLTCLVGPQVYGDDGQLNKAMLAAFLLDSEQNKLAVNDVVHPTVAADFLASGSQWLESAILFESGFDRRVAFDAVVCVTADLQVRVERVMRRDAISHEKALQWVVCQMPQEDVLSRSTFEIRNNDGDDVDGQIDLVLSGLKKLGRFKD